MTKRTDHRLYRTITDVERVEYPCKCKRGVYRFDPNGKRLSKNNQLPHVCSHCGAKVYFSIPYPALKYRERIFVDWGTIRGVNISKE